MHEWREANDRCLDGVLWPPVLRIDEAAARLGSWSSSSRMLSIAEHHIWEHAWEEVVATLRHEMAHQYVDEVLGGDGAPHGPAFVQACARLEVDAAATGTPTQGDGETERVLRKVRKLLALAESDNRHEAESAMAAANMLLLRYNLSLPSRGSRRYAQRRLGDSAAALPLRHKLVAAILSEFFFVECIWVLTYNARKDRTERVLEVLGTEANLAMAQHVHDFLHAEVQRLWRRAKGRVTAGRGGKREFIAGVLMGFSDSLRAQRRASEARGLVWIGDADLDAHVRKRHPRLRSLAGAGVRRTGAHEAGRAAGAKVRIRPPVGATSARGRKLSHG